jgi:hypothetical protein
MCSTGFSPPGCAGCAGCFQRRSESLLMLDVIQYRSVALSYTTAGWPTARPGTFLYLRNLASRLSSTEHELRQRFGHFGHHPRHQACHSHNAGQFESCSDSGMAGCSSLQATPARSRRVIKGRQGGQVTKQVVIDTQEVQQLAAAAATILQHMYLHCSGGGMHEAPAPCCRTFYVQHACCDECSNHSWITCSLKVTPSIQYKDPKPASKATDFGCTHQKSQVGCHKEELPQTASCTMQTFDEPRKQQDYLTLQEAIPIVVEP